MRILDHIIQGSESTQKNAIETAINFDFTEVGLKEGRYDFQHHKYIDTINGIGIYYNMTANYYFFTDENENYSLED